MAEFSFYGTWDDSRTYLERLAQLQQFTFVINKAYAEPTPMEFTAITDETWAWVQRHPFLLLWSAEYSRFPPIFDRPVRGFMRISVFRSGPAIEVSLPRPLEQDGQLRIHAGDIMYQARYQDPDSRGWYDSPKTIRSTFNVTRSLLRKFLVRRYVRVEAVRCGRIRLQPIPVWIGHAAHRLLEEHRGVLGPSCWTLEDLAETADDLALQSGGGA
jgi:hypothetical protein